MKVRIDPLLLEVPDAWNTLDIIMPFFQEERHLWTIDNAMDIKNSQWIQSDINGRAGKRNIETLEKCFTKSIYPSASKMHTVEVIISNNSGMKNQVCPANAVDYLSKPLYVCVENSTSDGDFLDTMIYVFKRTALMHAQTDGWWQFEHLGGYGASRKTRRTDSHQYPWTFAGVCVG